MRVGSRSRKHVLVVKDGRRERGRTAALDGKAEQAVICS